MYIYVYICVGTFQMTGTAELDNVCEALGIEFQEEDMEVCTLLRIRYFTYMLYKHICIDMYTYT
jgi:hypothetical protein